MRIARDAHVYRVLPHQRAAGLTHARSGRSAWRHGVRRGELTERCRQDRVQRLHYEMNRILNSEPECPGDGNLDKVVDFEDVLNWLKLAHDWGGSSVYDFNFDGLTDRRSDDHFAELQEQVPAVGVMPGCASPSELTVRCWIGIGSKAGAIRRASSDCSGHTGRRTRRRSADACAKR